MAMLFGAVSVKTAARVRADLAVYVETITRDSKARKEARHGHQRVARARLAYQGARNTMVVHVASHDAATTRRTGDAGMSSRRASA